MNVDVWVFYPEDHPLSTDLKRAIGNQVEARGWSMQVRPVAEVRVAGGRPMLTVAPRDATAIYKRAHRAFVSVLIAGRPVVRVDPSRNLSARHAMELERFVRYKCLAQRIAASDGLVNVRAYLANAEHWIQRVLCDGENDPRVLPLHMFVPDEDQTALGTTAGRRSFDIRFGRGSRTDPLGTVWERASVFHGREALTVSGRTLVAGFHWDVQNNRRSARRLATTDGVWELGGDSYVNVYPDGHVRARHNYARQVWPR